MNINIKSEEIFLVSLCYKSIINQLILHCSSTDSHIHYHVPLPIKLRRLLVNIVRSAIVCGVMQNEHHIDVMCDVLLKEPMFSHSKIETILFILSDVFLKINNTLKKDV